MSARKNYLGLYMTVVLLVALIACLVGAIAFAFKVAGDMRVERETGVVVGSVVMELQDEPVARYYIVIEQAGEPKLVEVGPALYSYECFEVGDTYTPDSVGRCEDVVWP